MPRPVAVAITGGIGAGKSEALRAFARHGAAVVSSDEIVHHLLATDDEVRRVLVERFGERIVGADGRPDRGAIAQIVFADRAELAPYHVENPREVVSQGDLVNVKIIEVDADRRRLSLSLKRVEPGEAPEPLPGEEAPRPQIDLSEDVFADELEEAPRGAAPAVEEEPVAEDETAEPAAEAAVAEPEVEADTEILEPEAETESAADEPSEAETAEAEQPK